MEIKFSLWLADGTLVDRTIDDETMQFEPGDGQWLPALESHVIAVAIGETKQFLLAPECAFGFPDASQVHWLPREDLGDTEPVENALIEFDLPNGEGLIGRVLTIEADRVQLDFSHPLAGQELILEVERIA